MKINKISSQKTIFYQKISNMFLNLKNNFLFIQIKKMFFKNNAQTNS